MIINKKKCSIIVAFSTWLLTFISPAFANNLYDLKYKWNLKANEVAKQSAPIVESGGSLLVLFAGIIFAILVIIILLAVTRK